jgi:hypothetical protein
MSFSAIRSYLIKSQKLINLNAHHRRFPVNSKRHRFYVWVECVGRLRLINHMQVNIAHDKQDLHILLVTCSK